MSQNNYIVGTLIVAFLLYIVSKGELPAYIALLLPQAQAATQPQQASNQNPYQQYINAFNFAATMTQPLTGF